MERITAKLDLLQSDKAGVTLQSMQPQRSSTVKPLALLMKQVKANYPSQEISEETAMIWLDVWQAIVNEHGLEVFRSALRECLKVKLFLPLPADIEGQIKSLKQAELDQRSSQWRPCESCACGASSEGWVVVNGFAERAGCWRAARAGRKSGAA